MKSTIAFLALATISYGQNIPGIPECAQSCVVDAIRDNTSCDVTDSGCVCGSLGAIQDSATNCVIEACGYEVAACKFCSMMKR